jgi:hypothetical protein
MEEEKRGLRKIPEAADSKVLFDIVNNSYANQCIALSHDKLDERGPIVIHTTKCFNLGETVFSLQQLPVVTNPKPLMITKHLSEFYDLESSILQYLVHCSDDPSIEISKDGLSFVARKDLSSGFVLSFNFNSTELEINRLIPLSSSHITLSFSSTRSPRGFRSLSLDEMKDLLIVKQINCSRLIINYFKRCLLEHKLHTYQPLHLLAISPNYAAYAYSSVDLHCSSEPENTGSLTETSSEITTVDNDIYVSPSTACVDVSSTTYPSSLPLLTSESRLLTNHNVEDLLSEISSLSSPYDCIINLCDGYQYDSNDPGLNILQRMENYAIPFTGSNSRVYTLTKADIRESGYSPNFITYAEYDRILRRSLLETSSNDNICENSEDMLSVEHETALKAFFQSKNLLFPLFIKPNSLGGSLYIDNECLVHNHSSLYSKLKQLLTSSFPYNDFLIQEYIQGDEYTCLTFRNREGKVISFKPIKISFPNIEYAFKSDQLKNVDYHLIGMKEEENDHVIKEIQEVCKEVYESLGLNAYIRYDIRYRSEVGAGVAVEEDSEQTSEKEEKGGKATATKKKKGTRSSKGHAYIIDINSYPGIFGITGEECSTDLIIQKYYSYPRFLYDMIYNALYDPFNYYNAHLDNSFRFSKAEAGEKVVSLSPSTTAVSLSSKIPQEDEPVSEMKEKGTKLSLYYCNHQISVITNEVENSRIQVPSSSSLTTFSLKRKIFLLNYQRISPKTIICSFSSCFFTILENLYNLESITIEDLIKNPPYYSFVYFWPSFSYYYSPSSRSVEKEDIIVNNDSMWKESSSVIDILEFYQIRHNGLKPAYRPFFCSNNQQFLQSFFSSKGIKMRNKNEIYDLDQSSYEVLSMVLINHNSVLHCQQSVEDYCNTKTIDSKLDYSVNNSWMDVNNKLITAGNVLLIVKSYLPDYYEIYQVDLLIPRKECNQADLELLNVCIPSVSIFPYIEESQFVEYSSFLV